MRTERYLRPDEILDGKYKIVSVVGAGGFGTVYKAWQADLGRTVAIKMLGADAFDEVGFARLEREATALSRVNHPNIARVFAFGIDEHRPYLVMEYLEGDTLQEHIQCNGPMSLEEATDILIQVCDGLSCAHKNNLVHRDLKPSNIMLAAAPDRRTIAKIIDFGLVRAIGCFNEQRLTEVGQVVGTADYMSPEQCRGENADQRSDLYAVGGILFALLSGHAPYAGANNINQKMLANLTLPPPLLANDSNDRRLSGAQDFIAKAMDKEPVRRYADSSDAKNDLVFLAMNQINRMSAYGTALRHLQNQPSKRQKVIANPWMVSLIGVTAVVAIVCITARFAHVVKPLSSADADTISQATPATDAAQSMFRDANDMYNRGMFDKAEELLRQSQKLEPVFSDPFAEVSRAHLLAKSVLHDSKRQAEAIPLGQRALALSTGLFGPNEAPTAHSHYLMAMIYRQNNQLSEAEKEATIAVTLVRNSKAEIAETQRKLFDSELEIIKALRRKTNQTAPK